MAQKQKVKQQFNIIRKKYPQKLTQISNKQALLKQCIEKFYLSEFMQIFQQVQKKSTDISKSNNQKVLDENDGKLSKQKKSQSQLKMNANLIEAVKIVIQAYEKNPSFSQVFNFEQAQQMVQKTKITFKDIAQSQNLKSGSQIEQNVPKNSGTQQKKQKQQNSSIKQQKSIEEKTQPAPKPKSNSLFVQKQTPVSQKGLFKNFSKGQSKQSRPSSRLLNQKVQQNIIPQKPRSRSSAKSNMSKRSHVSSKGQPQKIPNNNLQPSKLPQQQNQLPKNEVNQFISSRTNQNSIRLDDSQSKQQTILPHQQLQLQPNLQQPIVENDNHQYPEQIQAALKKLILNTKNNHLQLPAFKLSSQRPLNSKKSPINSILTNPFIKKTFTHLCKQSYIGGGKTFDQIAQSSDIMTLNKWMVFCKQFDFLAKLKKKVLVDIFHQTTSNKPQMNQQQFLEALIILQNKLRVDEQDFIHKSMCLDSELAFRQRVATFKISYSGPKQNFFEESTIKPIDKYYQNLRQSKFQQERKKKRQVILFQGKFKQEIQKQLFDRKNLRDMKRSHLINSVMFDKAKKQTKIQGISASMDVKNNQKQIVKSPYLNYVEKKSAQKGNFSGFDRYEDMESSKLKISRRIDPLTYTELFSQKQTSTTRVVTTEKNVSQLHTEQKITQKNKSIQKNKNEDSKFISNPTRAVIQLSKIKFIGNIQNTSLTKYRQTTQKKPQKVQQLRAKRQWAQQIKNLTQNFDKSESQQSDQILRQHLKGEKIKNTGLPKKLELSHIIEHYKKDQKWLQLNKDEQDQNSQWDRQTQLQTTSKKQRFR